jgi:hypothetical protein
VLFDARVKKCEQAKSWRFLTGMVSLRELHLSTKKCKIMAGRRKAREGEERCAPAPRSRTLAPVRPR